MPSPDQFISAVRKVAVGDVIDLEQFTRHLAELGYEKNYQVQTSGEFSVRGGIIDIFPLTEENPFRIELWDDEVDSIRSFDAESQRSIENLDEVHIYPACELVLTKEERDAGIARILASLPGWTPTCPIFARNASLCSIILENRIRWCFWMRHRGALREEWRRKPNFRRA